MLYNVKITFLNFLMHVEIRNISLYKIWIVTLGGTERVGSCSNAFLSFIREVHSSNLNQDTAYSERGFRGFPQSLREDPVNQATNTSISFRIYYSWIILSFHITKYNLPAASLNK
jgi:hypothetical protein